VTVGLFVEGTNAVDVRGHDALRALWEEIAGRPLFVHGFSKAQLVALQSPPGVRHDREPLDIFIERCHRGEGFRLVILAFDAEPPNQYLARSCPRSEVDFVLERFVARRYLPQPFLAEAGRLLQHYAQQPRLPPRAPGRPPHGPLDVLLMDPMFESLLVADEGAALRTMGFARRPRNWPTFDATSRKPDMHIFQPMTRLRAPRPPRRIRGDFRANKHGWALEIIRSARPNSPLWHHAIAKRLALLLA
jgi:hypothetical protein